MRRVSSLLLVGGACLLVPLTASAAGAWFLTYTPDARTVALGSVGVALESLEANTHYNPASIVPGPRAAATWTHWASDFSYGTSYDHFGAACCLAERLGFAANVAYMQYGATEAYDEHGKYLGTYRSYDVAPGISAAYRILPALTAGMTLKGIYSRAWPAWIWEVMPELGIEGGGDAYTVAGDAGVQYRPQDALTMGLSVANLGPDLRYDSTRADLLPRIARVGFAVRPPIPGPLSATVTGEMSRDLFFFATSNNRELYHLGAGIELGFARLAFVRLGYIYNSRLESGLTWGVGLSHRGIALDVGVDHRGYVGQRNVRFQLSAGL